MKHTALILAIAFSSFSKPALADSFTYKGCYEASAIKSSLQYNNQYTFQSSSYCENKCSGSKIAALINGNKCYCGDTAITSDSTDDSKCNTECTGYGYENCGGDGDYFSVYENSDDVEDDSESSSDGQSSTSTSSSSSSSSPSSSSKTSSTTTTSSSSSITSSSSTSSSSSSSSSSPSSSTPSSSSTSTPSSSSTETPSSSSSIAISSSSKASSTTVHSTTHSSKSSSSSSSSESASVNIITITQSNSATVITQTASASAAAALNAAQNRSNSSLSKGSIAGIVIGVLAGVALVAGLIFFCIYKLRKRNEEAEANKSDEMIQNYVQSNAMNLKQKSSNSTLSDFIDDEKHINNDGFVFMSNEERIAFEKGKRRFSDGSLPDARDNSGTGLRVTNPDL